jgi:hypothetical protein
VLANQEADGWFRPRPLRTLLDGKPDLWPHMACSTCFNPFTNLVVMGA